MTARDPFAALVAQGQAKIAAAAAPAGVLVGELLPPAAPSRVHAAVLGALDELLTRITAGSASSPTLPATARMMLATIKSMRPMMEDGVNRMPEEQLRVMLLALRGRIDAALIPDA